MIVVVRRIDAMTMNSERTVIELEAGWAFMQKGITKLKNLLEGFPEQQFSSEEYMLLYTYPFKKIILSDIFEEALKITLKVGALAERVYKEDRLIRTAVLGTMSSCNIAWIPYLHCTGEFTTCARKSLRKITLSSSMTDTGSLLRSISITWYGIELCDFSRAI